MEIEFTSDKMEILHSRTYDNDIVNSTKDVSLAHVSRSGNVLFYMKNHHIIIIGLWELRCVENIAVDYIVISIRTM